MLYLFYSDMYFASEINIPAINISFTITSRTPETEKYFVQQYVINSDADYTIKYTYEPSFRAKGF